MNDSNKKENIGKGYQKGHIQRSSELREIYAINKENKDKTLKGSHGKTSHK